VERVQGRRATTDNIPVHVPAIILSAAAELDLAYGPGGNLKPKLSRISEDDQRITFRSLSYKKCSALHPGMWCYTTSKIHMLLPLNATLQPHPYLSLPSRWSRRRPYLISRLLATNAKISRRSAGWHQLYPVMHVATTKYRARLQLNLWRKDLTELHQGY
jgi:hypothetical protein